MTQTFYSHGKLLLTSEYLVLDGAEALALPSQLGQRLVVEEINKPQLQWKSILADGSLWIEHIFDLPLSKKIEHPDPIIKRLHEILTTAQLLQPDFLSNAAGYRAISTLEFNKDWGLGSSSTLIANIAGWAGVDPYYVLEKTFGGSGYDIACATHSQPIIYKKIKNNPEATIAQFNPSFKDQLFFVYLNRKQNSRESIRHYKNLPQEDLPKEITFFSSLTQEFTMCENILAFEKLVNLHEERLSKILKTPTIKNQLFADYPRAIKSLGGWGGDFIMAVGKAAAMSYFKKRGYETCVPYKDMILD